MAIIESNLINLDPSVTLKAGQRMLKIGNSFVPVGIGGNVEPGSGGSAEYYRCASVDTAAKTWTGYKAVLTDGVYSFDTNVTTGLTYTNITPIVGSIYSSDVMVAVSRLGDPLDNYHIFLDCLSLEQPDLTLDSSATLVADSSLGRNVIFLPDGKTGTLPASKYLMNKSQTRFIKFKPSGSTPPAFFWATDSNATNMDGVQTRYVYPGCDIYATASTVFNFSGALTQNQWYKLCYTMRWTGSDYDISFYLGSTSAIATKNNFGINISNPTLYELLYGGCYVADVRVYEDVLAASDIARLMEI